MHLCMNWEAISFDWNQVRAFLATSEEGSFSAAARVLKTTQPTIGRQVAELEQSLGVTLVERSARGPTLTEAGRDLAQHMRAMGQAATLISMAATGHSSEVAGDVTVTATDLLSASILPDLIGPLRRNAPGIRLRIDASNDTQNLLQRDADIAIRNVRPDQPDLIGRHVGDFRAYLYAATAYLDAVGRPRTPRDIADMTFVGAPDPDRLLPALHHMGIPVGPEKFVADSNSGVVVWELVQRGFGVSMLPEPLCAPAPGVEQVLPSLPPLEFPIWLVTHRELRTSRRIRLVFDELARGLKAAARPQG